MPAKLKYVYVVSGDPERDAAFYRAVLDLEPRFADGDKWIQMTAENASVAVASRDEGPKDAAGAIAVFEVDDLARARASIGQNGGEIVRERDMGDHGYVVTARDNSGNLFELFHRAAPSEPAS